MLSESANEYDLKILSDADLIMRLIAKFCEDYHALPPFSEWSPNEITERVLSIIVNAHGDWEVISGSVRGGAELSERSFLYPGIRKFIEDHNLSDRLPQLTFQTYSIARNKQISQYIEGEKKTVNYIAEKARERLLSLCESIEQSFAQTEEKKKGVFNELDKLVVTAKEKFELELQKRLKAQHRKRGFEKAIIMFAFCATIFFIMYVFVWAIRLSPSVSIDLNAGDLIGGTLLGVGALLAGGAYAFKTLNESDLKE